MALIYCPDCGKQVSEHAEVCSNCGYPIGNLLQPFISYEDEKNGEERSDNGDCNVERNALRHEHINSDIPNREGEPLNPNIGNKERLWKWAFIVSSIIILVVIGVSITNGVILSGKNGDLQLQVEDYQSQIEELKRENDNIKSNYSSLQSRVTAYREQVLFMDRYIVIVGTDKYYYHKYGCSHCNSSSFLAFNTENAKSMGYHPCPYCMKG